MFARVLFGWFGVVRVLFAAGLVWVSFCCLVFILGGVFCVFAWGFLDSFFGCQGSFCCWFVLVWVSFCCSVFILGEIVCLLGVCLGVLWLVFGYWVGVFCPGISFMEGRTSFSTPSQDVWNILLA